MTTTPQNTKPSPSSSSSSPSSRYNNNPYKPDRHTRTPTTP
jgi:hypothetical protein